MSRLASATVAMLAALTLALTSAGPGRASEQAEKQVRAGTVPDERVALAILREALPIDAASGLTRAAGVRVEQMYREYLGGLSPVTTGIAIGPAETLDAAMARYAENEASWFRHRTAQFAELLRSADAARRPMIERAAADVVKAQADFSRHGPRVDRLVVRGSDEALQRLRAHPSVATVEVK